MKGKLIAFLIPVVYVFALLLVVSPSGVSASDDHKIKICHATSSTSNPYTFNNVDKNATAGGHSGHNGSVWTFGASSWGDIIPPYSYTEREVVSTTLECPNNYTPSTMTCPGQCRKVSGNGPTCKSKIVVDVYGDVTHQYAGKNWTTEGQAVYNNNCYVPVKCNVTTPIVYSGWSEWQINPENEAQMFRVKFGSHQDLFGRGSCEVAPVFEYMDRPTCEWNETLFADDPACAEPETCAFDETLLADDPACVAPEEPEEPQEPQEQNEPDEPEVLGTTDVVVADTGASDSSLVYLVEGLLVLGTLVSSVMFVKKYAI